MSNYIKSVDFAAKDDLVSGDPGKIIKGTEITTEYNNIATAVTTKAENNSPALTGNPTATTQTPGNNTTRLATTAFVQNVAGALGTMSSQDADAVAITGGTIAGATVNGSVVGSNSVGVRTVSTVGPTGGADGDIWYRY